MKLGPYAIESDYSQYVQRSSSIIYAVVSTATKGPIETPTVCTSPSDLVNKFGSLNPNCLGLYAAYYFLSEGSKVWFVRAAGEEATESKVNIAGVNAQSTSVADALVFKSLTKGTYYDGYTVTIENVSQTEDKFDIIIKNSSDVVVESHKEVSLAGISEEFTSNYVVFSSKSVTATKLTEGSYSFAGGSDGIENISNTAYINAGQTLKSDLVDMNVFAVPGVSDMTVITSMLAIAEERGDCLYLVDPANNLDSENVVNWHNGTGTYSSHSKLNSSYGACYYAWQRIYDPYSKVYVEVPPSVVVAPAIAKSARETEIWYAPAGLRRGLIKGVTAPVYSPDSGTVSNLYSGDNNINCIINDPQAGLCIFGQKTLHRDSSALNRVNVRLLLNYLKRIIVATCKYMTFEPNDRVTWNNFEDLIEPVLRSIQSRRGIDEYRIVKGTAIVTDNDIDNYRMPCKIMIKPTKSAEEIPIYFTITNTGADFNEILEDEGLLSVE